MWIRMSLVAAVVAVSLSGCIRVESCPGWVDFETPQDLYDDARLVVTGEAEPAGGDVLLYGAEATVYRIHVDDVLKGDPGDGDLLVASTPFSCGGQNDPSPDGDPLDIDGEVILFLFRTEAGDGWRTATPLQGVLPMPDDGVLPFEVADR
jgi:hypothetical protein